MATDKEAELPYRDASLSVDIRVTDLLERMTLEEKVGQMFHNMTLLGPGGSLATANSTFNLESIEYSVLSRCMSHFNLLGPVSDVKTFVKWYNNLQSLALTTRLGIPITLSTDPRNHFTQNAGTSASAGVFSQWPETLGLAALRSTDLVRRFADIARQEYLALGFRCALHPQIDLATEYRWARINGTFGEDAELSAQLVEAYIQGFQGDELGASSVSTMVKHFPGGGPLLNGEDSHFPHGRDQVYPGKNFEYHLRPFVAAIRANASQVMPAYGVPTGMACEEVAFAFNHAMITTLLREKLQFRGIVCTDWGLVTDAVILGQNMPARAWGCEKLSPIERVQKILDAGCDQFGGESCTQHVLDLVKDGRIPESRIDASVRRILTQTFTLGLFEKPFIDLETASRVVGCPDFSKEAFDAQMKAYTVLTNHDDILPLKKSSSLKVYLENVAVEIARQHGFQVVGNIADADVAIIRLQAPFEPRSGGFEAMFHAGSLEYPLQEAEKIMHLLSRLPTIVDVYLDRPAVLTSIDQSAKAVLVSFGASDDALLNVITGKARPQGKLPFDLPSSMEAVAASRSDVPYDTKKPLFRFGHGLGYKM